MDAASKLARGSYASMNKELISEIETGNYWYLNLLEPSRPKIVSSFACMIISVIFSFIQND